MRPLPHPRDILAAREWLRDGAPAAAPRHDAPQVVRTLLDLVEALPSRFEQYNFGTPAWLEAMGLPTPPAGPDKP